MIRSALIALACLLVNVSFSRAELVQYDFSGHLGPSFVTGDPFTGSLQFDPSTPGTPIPSPGTPNVPSYSTGFGMVYADPSANRFGAPPLHSPLMGR
jgi:hypothetical protein